MRPIVLLTLLASLLVASLAPAADPVYREKNKYPVLDEMKAAREARHAARDSVRAEVDAIYRADAEARDEARQALRVDWSGIEAPESPAEFTQVWHTPPVPQYYTGTCWAFCSTSFLESESKRIAGNEIKLSEMWVVYWEYVEKARSFLREFGHTPVAQGGQDVGTLEICRQYGIVPRDAYPGVLTADGRYDHTDLERELSGYLDWVLASGTWDEERNLAYVRSILDKHMGPPPGTVAWEGRQYTPREFLVDVLQLDLDAYRGVVSRLDRPFNESVLLDVEDNWRRVDTYLNLPLDTFYAVIKRSLAEGYSVSIGGDNSEPGMDGLHDKAIVPEWDIPAAAIDQGAREFRIVNGTTTDDHGVHLVGTAEVGGREWFLVKDSNRSSRLGEHKGYYFWDGDYIRLKMLSYTVHRDMLEGYVK
ncbi:peptidase C1 [bacterium]|nr:peptidase C1 [bacterium]